MREWDHGIWTGIGPPTDWGECEETLELLLSIGPPAGPRAEDYCKIAIMWTWSTDIPVAGPVRNIILLFVDWWNFFGRHMWRWRGPARLASLQPHIFHKSIKRNEFVREYKRTKSSKYGRIFKSHKTVCGRKALPEKNCDFPKTESTIICQIYSVLTLFFLQHLRYSLPYPSGSILT